MRRQNTGAMPEPAPELSVVIPTIGRRRLLGRVLDRLVDQGAAVGRFEVVVVADANETDPAEIARLVEGRPYPGRSIAAPRPGASAARNTGIRAAAAPVVLFIDDDILPRQALVAGHLEWHRRYPDERTAVLGHVGWSPELDVTPFMRWLEQGIQFDYGRIPGTDAGWGRFYTANVSVKRALLERAGGFDEKRLPFGYEDLDLAYRLHQLGMRLLYNHEADAEHLHSMDLDFWRRRLRRTAVSERRFTELHPDVPPYFHRLFTAAVSRRRARGRGVKLARFVPPWVPVLGTRVWASVDAFYTQALAPDFLAAWEAAGEGTDPIGPDLTERDPSTTPEAASTSDPGPRTAGRFDRA
jgi:glycosyltransferase involved in cell wall biosynthesis